MSDKLKIYACSGVGTEPGTEKVPFVTEGTTAGANTQGMNLCLAKMNLLSAELRNLTMSDAERAERLNELDIYSICFYYARLYKSDKEQLKTACQAIAQFDKSGGFDSDSTDATWHEGRINDIIAKIDTIINDGNVKETKSDLYKWLKSNIIDRDVVGLSGVGATIKEDYGDLNEYLYNGGVYFLYLFTPRKLEGNATAIYKSRRAKQLEVYNYCKHAFCYEYGGIYGDEQTMIDVIRGGIIEDLHGTPEEVLTKLFSGDKSETTSGVGIVWTATAIVSLIVAILSVIMTAVQLILQYAASIEVAKYTVPDDIEYGYSDEDDFDGSYNIIDKVTNSIKNYSLLWGAAAVGAYLLFKRKK